MHTAVPRAVACAVYRRRRPEHTPLYLGVQEHLETTCRSPARGTRMARRSRRPNAYARGAPVG